MSISPRLTRRTVLKGLGTALALPLLEGMTPFTSLAKAAAAPVASPKRMAFVYVPNGKHMQDWTPKEEGADFTLPYLLEPLKPFQKDLLVLTSLAQNQGQPHGDGPGDHARASATFLTGAHPVKTSGANIKVGVSVDQVAAAKVGFNTRLPSLEIGCDRGAQSGSCDSGYSCAYSANSSWKTESTPVAKEINPRLVFERLFSNGDSTENAASRAKRDRYKNSILDFVMEDAKQLKQRVGVADGRKLEEYLTSVRELETRIVRAGQVPEPKAPDYAKPSGTPKDYQEHIRLMSDLLVLAFQGDVTRISTFVHANDGSNRSYPFVGVSDGHHDCSHHGGNKDKHEKLKKINHFHVTQFAYLLEKLKAVKEGEGTLLDNCMVVYGSGISDGDRHNHNELPVLLAGQGGGTIKTGRHVRYSKDTPMNNLFLSMLDRMDVSVKSLGDSTGRLAQLD